MWRKYRTIKLVIAERRRNYLESKPNYDTTKTFTESLLAIEMRKTQALMNKSVYLGWSTLDLSKTVMYEFWNDYVKLKYDEKKNVVIWIQIDSFFMQK